MSQNSNAHDTSGEGGTNLGFLISPLPSALCAIPAQLCLGTDVRRTFFFTLSVTALFDTAQIFLLPLVTSARARSKEVTLLNSLKGREAQTPEPAKAREPQKKKPQMCCRSIWGTAKGCSGSLLPHPSDSCSFRAPQNIPASVCGSFWGSLHKTQLGDPFPESLFASLELGNLLGNELVV